MPYLNKIASKKLSDVRLVVDVCRIRTHFQRNTQYTIKLTNGFRENAVPFLALNGNAIMYAAKAFNITHKARDRNKRHFFLMELCSTKSIH